LGHISWVLLGCGSLFSELITSPTRRFVPAFDDNFN
jgi:hypothetical protein